MKCYEYGLIVGLLVLVISCVFLIIVVVLSYCCKERVRVLFYWVVLSVFFVIIKRKIDNGLIWWYFRDIDLIWLEEFLGKVFFSLFVLYFLLFIMVLFLFWEMLLFNISYSCNINDGFVIMECFEYDI